MSKAKPYLGLRSWAPVEKEALDRYGTGLVVVKYPAERTWVIESGATRRYSYHVFAERHHDGMGVRVVTCTCADHRKGRPCWHIAFVCHFYGIQIPYTDPRFKRGL